MPTQIDPSHNTDALGIFTGEFSFAKGATTLAEARAQGYRDIGNIKSLNLTLDPTKVEHYGSYRGVRRKDKTVVTQNKLDYTIVLDEVTRENLELLMGSTLLGDFTQPALTGATGQAFAFNTTPAVIGNWYEIRTAALNKVATAVIGTAGTGYTVGDTLTIDGGTGVAATVTVATISGGGGTGPITGVTLVNVGAYTVNPSSPNSATGGTGSGATITLTFSALAAAGDKVRRITNCTFSGKTEGTDYELDLVLGRVRWLTANSAATTPIITCSAIAASAATGFTEWTPMAQPVKTGYGRVVFYDTESGETVVIDHSDFSCDVSVDSVSDIDGESFVEVTLTVSVTQDEGTYMVRNLNRSSGLEA